MKYCNKCGAECADEAKFCPRCGDSFAVGTSETPPTPVTFTGSDMGGTPPVYAAPVQEAPKNNATLWLILNIVTTVLCCCCGGGLLNIVGIVFAAMAMNKYKTGDIDGAQGNEKVAMIMFFVGLGLSVVLGIVGLATGILGSIADGFDSGFSSYY